MERTGNTPCYSHVFFDLDGTLTDPLVGITRSVAYALGHLGIHVSDPSTLTPFIGPPLADSFRDFYQFTPEQCSEAIRHYREYFLKRGWAENLLYPGIPALLGQLRDSGVQLFVATSKGERSARRILRHFHLTRYFTFIGGDTPRLRRPSKADVLRYILRHQGLRPTPRFVMVGDRMHDVAGAEAVGMKTIGVLYGYGSREELQTAGAACICNSVAALKKTLIHPSTSFG